MTLQRIVPYQQGTQLENQGAYPGVVEAALDNLTMQTQQLSAKIDYALWEESQSQSVPPPTITEPVTFPANAGAQSLAGLASVYNRLQIRRQQTYATLPDMTPGHKFKIIIRGQLHGRKLCDLVERGFLQGASLGTGDSRGLCGGRCSRLRDRWVLRACDRFGADGSSG